MKRHFTSILMLLCVGLLWGLNWPVIKLIMAELPPFTIRAIAFPCAAALLSLITLLQGHSLSLPSNQRIPLVFTSLFLIFGFNILTSLGQLLTEASTAAIVAYTMPAITAVLSAIYLRERIDWRILTGIVLGMTGLAVLISRDIPALFSNPAGLIAMLLAALSWAIGNVLVKATRWTLKPSALAAWMFACSAVLALPIVLLLEPITQLRWPSSTVVLLMIFHVLGPMVTCYMLWSLLLSRLPATVAAISILTAPIVGVLSSAWLLDDELSIQKLLSLMLIVLSIAVTLFKRSKSAGGVDT